MLSLLLSFLPFYECKCLIINNLEARGVEPLSLAPRNFVKNFI